MKLVSNMVRFLVMVTVIAIPQVYAHGCNRSDDRISEARRRFAYDFYEHIRRNTDVGLNIMLAPTTLASALSVVLLGSGGTTRQQIISTLFQNLTSQDTLDCFVQAFADPFGTNNIGDASRDSKAGFTLRTASKLYGEKSYRFNQTFIQNVKRFGVEMEEVDFARTSGPVREYINSWVSDATDDAIQNFFDPASINSQTAMAIVSALYFEGSWKAPFKKTSTLLGDFNVREGETISIDFMRRTGPYKAWYSENLDAQLLEMPYLSDEYYSGSMILILPQTSLKRTEDSLNEDNLSVALSQLFEEFEFETRLAIPKFEITSEYKLGSTIADMGMTDLVSAGVADLRPMLSAKNKFGAPLYVQTAVHKTVLKVNEEGTVGAGVTGIGLIPLSLPRAFTCDRPFLTVVYEKRSQNVLFIGRIVRPPTASQ